MNWSSTKDLKANLMRVWERGDLFREALTDNHRFPLRLPLKTPDSTDLSSRFDAVRSWAAELAANPVLRSGVAGSSTPRSRCATIADGRVDRLVRRRSEWLDKHDEWSRFLSLIETTRHSLPGLLPWLEKHPLAALELADDWPRLLAVVAWLIDHPRPSIYLRQVDLPALHTKFIESHRGVLAELLDLALPSEVVDSTKSRSCQFAARYGFRDKPVLIRFRVLDPEIIWGLGRLLSRHLIGRRKLRSVMHQRQAGLHNRERNQLSGVPASDGSIVVFGAGYGWEALARAVGCICVTFTIGETSIPTDLEYWTDCELTSIMSNRF